MRATSDQDEELHAEAVARARSERRSPSDVVNDALRSALRPIAPAPADQVTGSSVIDLGRRVTDAYRATTASVRGARLAAFDRGLAALRPTVVELIA